MNSSPFVTATWLSDQFRDLDGIEPLSQGGQKSVFSATHPEDGDVVLKLMLPNADIARTAREVVAVAQVESARIPRILKSGQLSTPVGECFWFREQRIRGQNIRECLESGPFAKPDLLRLALHVAETLVAAERVQIVHRDVKPENIIRDTQGDFWLIDFGLARHLGLESLTATANAFGNVTWGYSPIEQCRNLKQEIDARADLFALGVTLFECSTGVNPFRHGADNVLEILNRVEQGNLPRLNPSFSTGANFADLVATLTQTNRVHRPQSAQEAFDWIAEICAAEQVS